MATHHTPDGLQLRLRLPAGRCEITTADTTETVVEAEPLNGSKASREAAESLVETLRERTEGGHELTVEVPKRKLLGFGNAQVLIRVRGPHGLDLDAATASADVVVTGRLGAADVRTASGDVSIEAAGGATEVKTASGNVELGHMRDATDVKTMSGDVRCSRPAARPTSTPCRATCGSGAPPRARSSCAACPATSRPPSRPAPPCSSTRPRRPATSARSCPSRGTRRSGPADVDLRATSMSGDIVVTRAPAGETAAARD